MHDPRPTVSTVAVLDALHALRSLGLDAQVLMRGARIEERKLADPAARLPGDAFSRMFTLAEEISGDASIGLHAGERAVVRDLLSCLALSCNDVEEGLRHACRFGGLIVDALRPRLEDEGEHLHFTLCQDDGDAVSAHVVEYVLVVHARLLSNTTGSPTCLHEVQLRHGGDGRHREARRVFHCAVAFERQRSALVLSRASLREHARAVNPLVRSQIEKFAAALHAPVPEPFAERIAAAVRTLLAAGRPCDRGAVCRHLRTSEEAMVHALEKAQVTFADIRETVLMEAAQALLLNSALPHAHIAHCLGFGDAGTFSKRFKSRFGYTPDQYRGQAYRGLLQ